jgi:hypothetical protein
MLVGASTFISDDMFEWLCGEEGRREERGL